MQPSPPSAQSPLLTDLYQISMAQAYWKAGRHDTPATFDLFYRHPPFSGSLAVCAGTHAIARFLHAFRFTRAHTDYLSTALACHPAFLAYLRTLTAAPVRVHAHPEGALAAPGVPMLRVSGPLALVQLLETPLLNLVNYASLVATNALRFRLAAPHAKLYEFGLRRAQGPDGALSASKYCYMAGFDATSNVAAGYAFGIPVVGTHAHSFVQSFRSLDDLPHMADTIPSAGGKPVSVERFRDRVLLIREKLAPDGSDGELAAFIAYAAVYPSAFSALVDTYSTLRSGVPNFMSVALALFECGFAPIGIRLDSGDLGSLSVQVHALFYELGASYERLCDTPHSAWPKMVDGLRIMASNDITVSRLLELRSQRHQISAYGIGTHLVTCLEQPALGCVFKLSSISGSPCMKFSEDAEKVSLPGEKMVYRLYDGDGYAAYDVLMLADEEPPTPGEKYRLRYRSDPDKHCTLAPARVKSMLSLVWDGRPLVETEPVLGYLERCREVVKRQVAEMRGCYLGILEDSKRYDILISESLWEAMQLLREGDGLPKETG